MGVASLEPYLDTPEQPRTRTFQLQRAHSERRLIPVSGHVPRATLRRKYPFFFAGAQQPSNHRLLGKQPSRLRGHQRGHPRELVLGSSLSADMRRCDLCPHNDCPF